MKGAPSNQSSNADSKGQETLFTVQRSLNDRGLKVTFPAKLKEDQFGPRASQEIAAQLNMYHVDDMVKRAVQLFAKQFCDLDIKGDLQKGSVWFGVLQSNKICLMVLNNYRYFSSYIKSEEHGKILMDVIAKVVTRCYHYGCSDPHRLHATVWWDIFQQLQSWDNILQALREPAQAKNNDIPDPSLMTNTDSKITQQQPQTSTTNFEMNQQPKNSPINTENLNTTVEVRHDLIMDQRGAALISTANTDTKESTMNSSTSPEMVSFTSDTMATMISASPSTVPNVVNDNFAENSFLNQWLLANNNVDDVSQQPLYPNQLDIGLNFNLLPQSNIDQPIDLLEDKIPNTQIQITNYSETGEPDFWYMLNRSFFNQEGQINLLRGSALTGQTTSSIDNRQNNKTGQNDQLHQASSDPFKKT